MDHVKMTENEVFREFFKDIWKLVIESKDSTHTEAEWEKLLDQGKALVNDPRYEAVQDLAIAWINSFVSWLDARNRARAS